MASGEQKLIGNRYEIQEQIGAGGMGTVYRGVDTQTGAAVAIKALNTEAIAADPAMVERFTREAEALRQLNHPNIVKVLATVEENEKRYLVMEYVGGGSLYDLLKQQPQLPVQHVLEIALDLSDALTRAHRLKIIHRDIKPANVLLAEDGTPRLTDFGVAHQVDKSHITETGMMVGTLPYLSPEACNGEPANVRSDIWAFGVMLFEMLAGQRPFMDTSPAALLLAIMSHPVPDITEFREDIPPTLVTLINQMLEKDYDKRISSARQVGVQLEAVISSDLELETDADRSNLPTADGDSTPPTPSRPHTRQIIEGFKKTPTVNNTPTPAVPIGMKPITSTPARSALQTATRRISATPRIFISYRRSDSIAIVGRVYDRLVAAFGANNIFKDVDNIPAGVNFRAVLENEVSSCDVLLVIIGPNWSNILDSSGKRRLDNPEDPVRIEIETGLRRDDVLVIPVLVDNALMVTNDQLPGTLDELAYRNAAAVRNDPDFNRDIQWLIEQINHSFEVVKPARRSPFIWIGAGIVAILALILVVFALNANPRTSPSAATPGAVAAAFPQVEPVQANEYMVLVAQIEHVGGDARDVQRFITADLQQHLADDVPFSKIRIRSYPRIITSHDEAVQAADAAGAAVVVWGNYDAEGSQLEVQLGTLAPYPDLLFTRDQIERVTNVSVEMADERRQSVAPQVLMLLNVLHTFTGENFEVGRNVTILELINVTDANIIGNSVAAEFHRYGANFVPNTEESIQAIDKGISLDARNPVLFIARAFARMRVGLVDEAREDLRTAQSLGPKGWMMPIWLLGWDAFFFRKDLDDAINYLTQTVEARPDDWWAWFSRGGAYYFQHKFDLSRSDVERAIELGADLNFPYIMAMGIALREGRLQDAQQLYRTVREKFPDPTIAERMTLTTFGPEAAKTLLIPLVAMFGNLTLGQWREIINVPFEDDVSLSDPYVIRGLAYCNLKDYPAAEAAYTKAIEAEPDYALPYALRAEVRLHQGNVLGVAADALDVSQHDVGGVYTALLAMAQAGDVSCENFFDADLSAIPQPEAITPSSQSQ
jgi:serine/threonine protein kinase/tetratricopeptide (TPR) repeat protein